MVSDARPSGALRPWRAALACACLAVVGGCGGGNGGDTGRGAAPRDGSTPPAVRAPRLGRSHEAEVQALVADVAGRHARPRCQLVRRVGPGTSRFSCAALERRYRVDWEHYGTGRYTIAEHPGGRVVARGTLSISQ